MVKNKDAKLRAARKLYESACEEQRRTKNQILKALTPVIKKMLDECPLEFEITLKPLFTTHNLQRSLSHEGIYLNDDHIRAILMHGIETKQIKGKIVFVHPQWVHHLILEFLAESFKSE